VIRMSRFFHGVVALSSLLRLPPALSSPLFSRRRTFLLKPQGTLRFVSTDSPSDALMSSLYGPLELSFLLFWGGMVKEQDQDNDRNKAGEVRTPELLVFRDLEEVLQRSRRSHGKNACYWLSLWSSGLQRRGTLADFHSR
jgi:hypothetical protein